jgi:hypothetical protein
MQLKKLEIANETHTAPKTSYVTQTLNIKYRGTIEPRATFETRFTSVECESFR